VRNLRAKAKPSRWIVGRQDPFLTKKPQQVILIENPINMKTFTDSAADLLDIATTVAADVDLILINQDDEQRLNVKEYSERMQAEHGWNALFVATLVRTIVDNCGEYESRVGRNGGVGRVAGVKAPKRVKAPRAAKNDTSATVAEPVKSETASVVEVAKTLEGILPETELATPVQEPANQTDDSFVCDADQFETADDWLMSLNSRAS
jgi:hypothetical protein